MSGDSLLPGTGKEIAQGIGSCLVLNLVHLGVALLSIANAKGFDARFVFGVRVIVWFGVVQFAYVVPVAIVLRKTSRPNVAKGMLICAFVVFLLCAACWGSVAFTTGETPW